MPSHSPRFRRSLPGRAAIRRVRRIGNGEPLEAAIAQREFEVPERGIRLERRAGGNEEDHASDRIQGPLAAREALLGKPQHVILVRGEKHLERRAVLDLVTKFPDEPNTSLISLPVSCRNDCAISSRANLRSAAAATVGTSCARAGAPVTSQAAMHNVARRVRLPMDAPVSLSKVAMTSRRRGAPAASRHARGVPVARRAPTVSDSLWHLDYNAFARAIKARGSACVAREQSSQSDDVGPHGQPAVRFHAQVVADDRLAQRP